MNTWSKWSHIFYAAVSRSLSWVFLQTVTHCPACCTPAQMRIFIIYEFGRVSSVPALGRITTANNNVLVICLSHVWPLFALGYVWWRTERVWLINVHWLVSCHLGGTVLVKRPPILYLTPDATQAFSSGVIQVQINVKGSNEKLNSRPNPLTEIHQNYPIS